MTGTFGELTPRAAILKRWAHEPDPVAATAPARAGLRARFEREVDPDGELDDDERRKRADRLMRSHMTQLSARAVEARRRRSDDGTTG